MAFGQLKQTVQGVVTDAIYKPLAAANVQLVNADSTVLIVSGTDGRFSLLVNPGRYLIKATFTGYAVYEDELLVIAGKSNNVKIQLQESAMALADVEVNSSTATQQVPGGYTISIEKTMRMPANFFDPVRMATSLPGVVAMNDQANSISIKGYSPNAMLWRLNGLDIVNPNHLANAGTLSDRPVANGGGVSILSSQVLDRTDYYSGALPVQYGNALSGVFDMAMRPGNKANREHTVQASLIGIDLATEGPMGKRLNDSSLMGEPAASGSYLVNYRYSTVGLLSQLGVNFGDEAINFQDITFNLDFNHKKDGNLSVFGFGGLSSNKFNRKPENEWETEKDRYDIDFTGKVFGLGFMNTSLVGKNSVLKSGVAVSGQFQERSSLSAPIVEPHIARENFLSNRILTSALIDFRKLSTSRLTWNLGAMVTNSFTKGRNEIITTNTPPNVVMGNTTLNNNFIQVYFDTKYVLSSTWELTTGLRLVSLSGYDFSVEPRLSATKILAHGTFNLSYGMTSQMNQFHNYIGNFQLGLNNAHQVLAAYNHVFNNGLKTNVSTYFHYLQNVPTGFTSGDTVVYSVLNEFDNGFIGNLESIGKGRNYGADFNLERRFNNKTYFLITASVYRSEYKGRSLAFAPTRFSGNFTSSLNGGKEWGRRNKTFGLHTRLLYLGGMREQSIDATQSQPNGTTVYFEKSVFTNQLPNYFRLDLRASWRKNKPGYTRTISLDIQNVTAQQNVAYRYYDTFLQKVTAKNQLGIIPVLVYRVDF